MTGTLSPSDAWWMFLLAYWMTLWLTVAWFLPAGIATWRRVPLWRLAVLLNVLGLWPVAAWLAIRRSRPVAQTSSPKPAPPDTVTWVKPPPRGPIDPNGPDPRSKAWLS